MIKRIDTKPVALIMLLAVIGACKTIVNVRSEQNNLPSAYAAPSGDTTNIGDLKWKDYFKDTCLVKLIDSAMANNQELNSVWMELVISGQEVQSRKGEYLPFLNAGAGLGADKVGRYTSQGAMEATTELEPGKAIPEIVPDMGIGVSARWELDIWGKLHNAKYAAQKRYLSSVEGKNFLVTQIIGEIASSYYELQALDKQLEILEQNIQLQSNALNIVRQEKNAARLTELPVRKFEAEVFYTKSLQFEIQQKIVETENRINFLLGRMPQKVERTTSGFDQADFSEIKVGVPADLLDNRADVRKAEMDLEAAKLDVKVAKANFYPSLGLKMGLGFNSMTPRYFLSPESIAFGLAGDLMGPVVNRYAIKAQYNSANAKQMQAVYGFEKSVLNAMIEVSNQMSKAKNLNQSYALKEQQVQSLTQAINVTNGLFLSARADYMEVLMTQRDLLESRMQLVETRRDQFITRVNLYRALGGGWR